MANNLDQITLELDLAIASRDFSRALMLIPQWVHLKNQEIKNGKDQQDMRQLQLLHSPEGKDPQDLQTEE